MVNNTKYGSGALENNIGDNNTGIGAFTAYNNLGGFNNTAVGSNSAFFNTTGNNNTSLGAGSLCNNNSGSLNTAIGSSALEGQTGNSVGDQNVAIGAQSLYINEGNLNTAVGTYSGLGVTGGNYNSFLGANTSTLNNISYNYSTAIGYGAKVEDSNQIMLGGNESGTYPNVIIPGQAFLPNYIGTGNEDQIVPKSYVDVVAAGLNPTQTCICATTANISLSGVPPSSSTDGFDLSALADGSYNILVVNQGSLTQELTLDASNGVWIFNKTAGPTYTWSRPVAPQPMSVGYDAVGAFSFIQNGSTYGKSALVQTNKNTMTNLAIVGIDLLQYQIFYQLKFESGQGLNTQLVSGELVLNVDSSLNFINFLDSKSGEPNASGILALGTNSTTTIIGPTGGNPVQFQSQIEAPVGLTGATGSFSYLKTTNDALINNKIVGCGNSNISSNVVFGNEALYSNTTGYNNLAVGFQSLYSNTTGYNNVGVGYKSSYLNTTGNANTAVGYNALANNTTGLTTAIGYRALENNQGVQNTALGTNTLLNNTNGQQNTSIGYNALLNNSTGNGNTAVGAGALQSNTDGDNNVAIGLAALPDNTTGGANVGIGVRALWKNISGGLNFAIGNGALEFNETGDGNIAIGRGALGGANINSDGSIAIGNSALYSHGPTGSNISCIAMGQETLFANTTGASNIAIGPYNSRANETGSRNIGIGYLVMQSNVTGSDNIAIGNTALQDTTTGCHVAIGSGALQENTTGTNNVAIGYQALLNNTTGGNNTSIGYQAGTSLSTGANVTCIGYNAQPSSATATNEITLGDNSVGTVLRCVATTITAISDGRDKKEIKPLPESSGIRFISKLKPVNFIWDMRDGEKLDIPSIGFIAQDLQEAQLETNFIVPNLVYDKNPDRLEASYGTLIPVMVQAIKDLKTEIVSLKSEIEFLKQNK